jgi:hypothetical protein
VSILGQKVKENARANRFLGKDNTAYSIETLHRLCVQLAPKIPSRAVAPID